jgi:ribonuclease HII
MSISGIVAGIDEVGRGCLAGPVVACAVVLPPDYNNPDITDSKKLTAVKRLRLDAEIRKNALSIGLGVVCSLLIDKIGIVPATKQAMQLALARLSVNCEQIIIDAVPLNNLPCPSISPFKADLNYQCVGAASIVAKVYRDGLMDKLAALYPAYGWESNKGYGTKAHIDALQTVGRCPLHRRSFIKSYVK